MRSGDGGRGGAIDLPRAGEVVRPILKWAGGKRQLLPALRRYYPAAFNRYVEPFLGSGAVLFGTVGLAHQLVLVLRAIQRILVLPGDGQRQ